MSLGMLGRVNRVGVKDLDFAAKFKTRGKGETGRGEIRRVKYG